MISVERYSAAVYQVALMSLCSIIGLHSLDEVLKSRDDINASLQRIVDQATDAWGIKIEMVEMKDVPAAVQRAMAPA